MSYKNMIVEHGVMKLEDILFNPDNWRIHPLYQQEAMKYLFDTVGWVEAVVVNKRTGHLVNGHMRCQVAMRDGEETVPVTFIDVDEATEKKLIYSMDTITSQAMADKEKLSELSALVEMEEAFHERVKRDFGLYEPDDTEFGKVPDIEEYEEPEAGIRAIIEFETAEQCAEWVTAQGFEYSPYKVRYHISEIYADD